MHITGVSGTVIRILWLCFPGFYRMAELFGHRERALYCILSILFNSVP